MFGIGMPELILIALIALIVVGPKRLPDLAKSLGKGFHEFRRAADEVTDTLRDTLKTDDIKRDLHDFKDSLLYGKGDQAEQNEPALPADDATTAHRENSSPPKT